MPTYQINIIRLDGRLFRARDIEYADDEEAVVKSTQAADVEIWDHKRFVARLPGSPVTAR